MNQNPATNSSQHKHRWLVTDLHFRKINNSNQGTERDCRQRLPTFSSNRKEHIPCSACVTNMHDSVHCNHQWGRTHLFV